LLIGTVESAAAGNPFQLIRVQPAARLDRLEEVLVLMSQQELAPKKTEEAASASGSEQGKQFRTSQAGLPSTATRRTSSGTARRNSPAANPAPSAPPR
jgi:hypothetical protein